MLLRRSGREDEAWAKGGPKHKRRSGKAGQPRRYEEAMAQRAADKNKALAEAEAEAERAARRARVVVTTGPGGVIGVISIRAQKIESA